MSAMNTFNEIVEAARRLSPGQLIRLKKRIDELEKQIWQKELEKTTVRMRKTGITDSVIDRVVMRRRRESRR